MNTRSRLLRGGARVGAGLLVVGVAGGAVLFLSNATLPSVAREPLAITVDTTQDTNRTVVCSGSFAELGADPNRPDVALPTSEPAVTVAGEAAETSALERAEDGAGLPTVLAAPTAEPLGAAQLQAVNTETLRGVVASACTEPLNEQWLLGGASTVGLSTTLSVGNPGNVPATVVITVFDENGPVDAVQTSGVLVSPGRQQTISLNGYAPGRERLAVKVESTGAPVSASLGVGHVNGLDPYAVSTTTSQAQPSFSLVVPGVTSVSSDDHGPSDVEHSDGFGVVARVVAPGGEAGTASVRAIDAQGNSTDLGSVELSEGAVGELDVAKWPEDASTVVIEADVPVIAGVLGSAIDGTEYDYDWFAPAPILEADAPIAVPVVPGGRLVIANTGDTDADIEYTGAKGGDRSAVVPAGASIVVAAAADTTLTSSAPVFAGVRYVRGGDIAGYPVQAPDTREGALTVYTR